MERDEVLADVVAEKLENLYARPFGGRRAGKFRISRKFLRQVAGRRRLSDDFVRAVGEALFERGCVLVDLETHFVVLEQRLFNSYRRVTAAAVSQIMTASAHAIDVRAEPADERIDA